MKIYTRGGDQGETSLLGGLRVSKDSARMEACGTVDELNAALGMVRAEPVSPAMDQLLAQLQQTLFHVGAELATLNPDQYGLRRVGTAQIDVIEQTIDAYQQRLSTLQNFVLPTGTRAAATLHLARTICRRTERCVVTLSHNSPAEVAPELIAYLNRVGDLLFVLSRAANAEAVTADVVWPG